MKKEHSLNEDEMKMEKADAMEENQQEANTQNENNNEENATDETAPETDKLAVAEAKIAELQDKYLRQVAEFDNYRKRTLKEKAELILNGAEKTVVAILPILDDMERALQNMAKAEDVAAVKEGVELIYQKFIKTLEIGRAHV